MSSDPTRLDYAEPAGRPSPGRRLLRWVFAHAAACYLAFGAVFAMQSARDGVGPTLTRWGKGDAVRSAGLVAAAPATVPVALVMIPYTAEWPETWRSPEYLTMVGSYAAALPLIVLVRRRR